MTLACARRQLAFFCFFACLLGVVLVAATPTFWTVSSQTDFLKGDVEDLSIDSDGRMFLGPAASVLGETSAPFLWSIVAGADGALWFGERNTNAITRMTTSGIITASHAIPAANADPTSLATDRKGRIWIAEHSAGQLQRMTLTGEFDRPVRTRHAPDSIAFDRYGDLWYAASSDSRIGRVDVD